MAPRPLFSDRPPWFDTMRPLGATAVCIGRPYVWGVAGFGQAGVEAVLTMLRRELELVMRQSGVAALTSVGSRYVIDRGGW